MPNQCNLNNVNNKHKNITTAYIFFNKKLVHAEIHDITISSIFHYWSIIDQSKKKLMTSLFLQYSTTELLLISVRKTKEDTQSAPFAPCKVSNKGEGGT